MYFCVKKINLLLFMKILRPFVNSILFIATLQFLSSCSALYIANPGIDPIVFTKPAYHDSTLVTNYVGGKFNRSEYLNSYDQLTDNYFGQLYLFQTQTYRFFNTSFGAFGYLGKVGVEDNFNTNYKSYYGGGVSADVQLAIPIMNFTLKPIGIKGSLLYEDGEYYRLRYNDLQAIGIISDKFMCNISQTAGIDYQFRKNSLGLDISAGFSYMIPHMYMDLTYSAILNYTTPKFMIYLQKSGALMLSNDDLVIGLNFRLP